MRFKHFYNNLYRNHESICCLANETSNYQRVGMLSEDKWMHVFPNRIILKLQSASLSVAKIEVRFTRKIVGLQPNFSFSQFLSFFIELCETKCSYHGFSLFNLIHFFFF